MAHSTKPKTQPTLSRSEMFNQFGNPHMTVILSQFNRYNLKFSEYRSSEIQRGTIYFKPFARVLDLEHDSPYGGFHRMADMISFEDNGIMIRRELQTHYGNTPRINLPLEMTDLRSNRLHWDVKCVDSTIFTEDGMKNLPVRERPKYKVTIPKDQKEILVHLHEKISESE